MKYFAKNEAKPKKKYFCIPLILFLYFSKRGKFFSTAVRSHPSHHVNYTIVTEHYLEIKVSFITGTDGFSLFKI